MWYHNANLENILEKDIIEDQYPTQIITLSKRFL